MAIPRTTQTNHHVGDVLEDIAMSMRAEDFPHIAALLTNLYSDPVAAVIREYSTNAWDSHVTAGIDRPIEVTLPTAERLEFVVQDFGLGLSVDDLRDVYSMYGRSLKRDTNTVAGQLGLGCKSGLTYAEAFTITAVKGGVRTVAMSTKDEHGVGVIKILDTAGTDEPNGVRITIPVDRWDTGVFERTAHNLFQFWEPGTVLVNGEAPEVPEWRSTALMLDADTWLVRKDAGLHRSHVIMGNVAYPVPDVEVGRDSHRFVARLNIGDVDFVPSREAVHHTRHTDETLADLSEYVRTTYKRAIDSALASVTTRWEETMLKTLWMDRNTRLSTDVDHPIWHFDPSGYGRKAKGHMRYNMRDLSLPSLVVITGFTARNLSAAARERLVEFASAQGYKSPTFVIFPSTVPTGALDGRPRTFSWETVVGSTDKPKADKPKVKREKYETRYATHGGSAMTGDELAAATGRVLYVEPGNSVNYGDLGATVVILRSANQLPRVKRFVPGIRPYHEEYAHQRAKAEKAITDHDRKIVTARTLPAVLQGIKPDLLSDTDLAEYIRLAKSDQTTDTMKAAAKFGISIKPTTNLTHTYNKRYRLIDTGGYYGHSLNRPDQQEDLVIYLNAKHEATQAASTQAVA